MNSFEIIFVLPEGLSDTRVFPMTFFSATGTPVVGDIMKITPNRVSLRVVKREWIAQDGETHLHLHLALLEEPKP